MTDLPAGAAAFSPEALRTVPVTLPVENLTADWAWRGSTGQGVRVAVIDSGIDADHPAVGSVQGYVEVGVDDAGNFTYDEQPHTDAFGHGTACAGIIRSLAPDCELYSVKVLGAGLTGRGLVFAAGLRWAIEHDMDVCNLSLGSTKRDYFAVLHELADLAYFRKVILVTAANNLPMPSYPSQYAAVISVASHAEPDPYRFYYNPRPPVEFGAPGINVRVAWLQGDYISATGNSFAAPHISGLVTRLRAKHPSLTPFQIKTVLQALSANATRTDGEADGQADALARAGLRD